jgi:hypothetical protein
MKYWIFLTHLDDHPVKVVLSVFEPSTDRSDLGRWVEFVRAGDEPIELKSDVSDGGIRA